MPKPVKKSIVKIKSPYEGVNVYRGDCVKFLEETPHKYDLIFADPPFNIGQKYRGFVDLRPPKDYCKFTEQWITLCWDALKNNGTQEKSGLLCLHGHDPLCELYLKMMPSTNRIAWINWHYRFGQCGKSNWIDSRCHLLVYARGPKWTWNPEEVLVESDRVAYGDKRVQKTGGKRLPFTIWGLPSDGPYWGRVTGSHSNKERRPGHPNQLPEKYLERIILAYTNVGDTVLDPFGGSGTTAVVAWALGRRAHTVDISAENCQSIVERLEKGPVRVLPF